MSQQQRERVLGVIGGSGVYQIEGMTDAVWRRVEMVERGLSAKLLFAASERLRVSEQVLADHPSGALYVYKSSLSAKAVLDHLERLRHA